MAKHQSFFYFIIVSMILFISLINCSEDENKEVHIVYLGSIPKQKYFASSDYHQTLIHQVSKNKSFGDSLIRSYKRSFNGFAAKLTKEEAKKLANSKEVVSVFPSRTLQLQTTRSWNFLGFDDKIHETPSFGSDVIIGVIDTGIWPESQSFNDNGYSPPPKRWKGSCDKDFKCNNKIIGARDYTDNSTRDYDGHGSHTASIVAGNRVNNVSFYGLANGTARGGLLNGRIAVYKVCDSFSCLPEDILAAFDDAIADGVDIITISIGSFFQPQIHDDVFAIGGFHAFRKGILTVQSGGNQGPNKGTITSVAPWLLSVAASSTDRKIVDKLILGDGRTLVGKSINTISLNETKVPLIYGNSSCSRTCREECLDPHVVKGKILLCDAPIILGDVASKLGIVGVVSLGDEPNDISYITSFPKLFLNNKDFDILKLYLNSSRNPQGVILKSEISKDSDAPVVASFSSSGPNIIINNVLKPDISAPGVDILAAYSPVVPLYEIEPFDKRRVNYSILSGTSMACPHVAGVAAYIKSIHYDWSPSAIKSAIMTTASIMSPIHNPLQEFSYGSGHINPLKAIDPGLIYEISNDDYIKLLCSMAYDDKDMRAISGDNKTTCPKINSSGFSPKDLNYPSLTAKTRDKKSFEFKFQRTVTNVGMKNSTYKAKVFTKAQLNIKVIPDVLSFTSLNEKKSFTVTVSGDKSSCSVLLSASIEWFDGTHNVRSPIVIDCT